MKDSIKRCLGRAAAIVSALSFAISSLAFPASADPYYTRITYSDMASYIGSSVQGYYLADNGNMKPVTLWRVNVTNQYINSINSDALGASYAVNSYLVWYRVARPSDLMSGSDSYLPIFQIDWNLHFSNVTFIGILGGQTCNSQSLTLNVNYLKQYNYLMAGNYSSSVVPFAARSDNANLGNVFTAANGGNGNGGYNGCFGYYEGDAIDYYIGTQYFSDSWNVDNNWLYFCLSCPVINPDFVFEGHETAPEAPSYGSGHGTGSLTENSTGYDIVFDVDIPDYSSQLDDIRSELNPDYDSSVLDDMGDEMSQYHNLEESLLDNMRDQLSSMDSFEFDPDEFEDAKNPYSFFSVNIITIMVGWVFTLAFLGYILFGKWV